MTRGEEVLTVEGEKFVDRLVILEFPDRAKAMAWHDDADYQSASAFRRASSTGRMILQEGGANTANPDAKV